MRKLALVLALLFVAPSVAAIVEDDIIAVSGSNGTSTALDLTATDTTGSEGAILFVCHEGAPTTYTWTSQSGGSGGTFTALGTVNASGGAGSGDLSLNAVFVRGFTPGASHVFRVTFGATRPFRFGGGIVLSGTFDSSFEAATTQPAQFFASETAIDAGSLVTSAAAYLIQFACNYNAVAIDTAGSGWTIKSNATTGRHFQARNEAASGTFDPVLNYAADGLSTLTLAAAIKEAAGGGASSLPKIMQQSAANDDEYEQRLVANSR